MIAHLNLHSHWFRKLLYLLNMYFLLLQSSFMKIRLSQFASFDRYSASSSTPLYIACSTRIPHSAVRLQLDLHAHVILLRVRRRNRHDPLREAVRQQWSVMPHVTSLHWAVVGRSCIDQVKHGLKAFRIATCEMSLKSNLKVNQLKCNLKGYKK